MNTLPDAIDEAARKFAILRCCGTAITLAQYEAARREAVPTYVIPPREPVNMELVRYLWPELEAAK